MHSLTFFTATLAGVTTATGHLLQARDGTVTVTVTSFPEYCTPSSPLATAISPAVVQSGSTAITESVAVPVTPLSVPSTTEAASIASSVPVAPGVPASAFTNGTASIPVIPGTAPAVTPSANASVTTSAPSKPVGSSTGSTSAAATETRSTPATGSAGSGVAANAGLLMAVAAVAGSIIAFA